MWGPGLCVTPEGLLLAAHVYARCFQGIALLGNTVLNHFRASAQACILDFPWRTQAFPPRGREWAGVEIQGHWQPGLLHVSLGVSRTDLSLFLSTCPPARAP